MSRRSLLVVGSILLVGGTLAIPAQENAVPADDSPSANAKARLEIARKALEMASALHIADRSDFATVKSWSLRVVNAERDSGGDAIKAMQDHLDRMNGEVKILQAAKQAARATEVDILDAMYAVLEAEEMLAKAKSARAQSR